MERKPLVSIIITTYRRGELLARCIDSVLNQSYQNVEVIVVDDNLPDSQYRIDTEQVMVKYQDDKKVIYIKHPDNMRQAASLNTGINASHGEYIGFLDDDDEFLPTKIEKQVIALNKVKNDELIGGVFTNVYIKEKNNVTKTCYKIQKCAGNLIYSMLTNQVSHFGNTAMLKREVFDKLKGFNENLIRHVDYEFFTRFFNYYKLILIEEPLVRINIEGIRNNPRADRYLLAKDIFFKDVEPYLGVVDPKERKTIYKSNYFDVALSFFADGAFCKGRDVLKRALSYGHLSMSEWILLSKIIIRKYILHF